MRYNWIYVLCITLLCLVGTACGVYTISGTPLAKSVDSVAPSHQSNNQSPPLNQPELDILRYRTTPCTLLDDQQKQAVASGLPGREELSPGGLTCRWTAQETPAKIDFRIEIHERPGGLSALYAIRMMYNDFEEMRISGYPAVATHLSVDTRKHGICRLNVAVANQVYFTVDTDLLSGRHRPPDYHNACPRTVTIAEHIIRTLQRGG